MSTPAQAPRLAVIGISGYGRVHLQLARECRDRGEASIVAATVINPAEEAGAVAELQAGGCGIYADYREMLRAEAGRIDLCLIPTGIPWHARMTIAALQAGANVLVEKPLAASTAEVDAIRAAERDSGRFVAVGFQDFHEPGTAWLKTELQRGAIGDVRAVRFLGLWPRDRAYFTRNDWAGRLRVDGVPVLDSPLNNAFAHFVMLCLFFAAGRGRTAAQVTLDRVETFRAHPIESFDTCVVTAHTARGVRLWLGASHAGRETVEPQIEIVGSAGTASWRYETEARWEDAAGRVFRQPLLSAAAARQAMITSALRRLRHPDESICTTEMAGHLTALIEAVHGAARIATLPPELVRWNDTQGPDVPGLSAAMRRAFAAETPLAAAGFPPAMTPGRA